MENPEHGVTVDDPATGQQVLNQIPQDDLLLHHLVLSQVVLSEADADMVRRAAGNRVPDPNVDLYADHVPWFRYDTYM